MAFKGSTRDLGSFGEEMDEITDLHQILEEILLTERGDGVASIKRRRRDLCSVGVWILAMVSQCSRLKVELEPSTWRRRQKHQATLCLLLLYTILPPQDEHHHEDHPDLLDEWQKFYMLSVVHEVSQTSSGMLAILLCLVAATEEHLS
nr:hypothetical protein [Tanacetum cinerariifolium]